MSLFKLNISQVTGRGAHLFSDETEILFNGTGIYALEQDEPTSSRFNYLLNLEDDREGDVRVEAVQSVTNVSNAVERDYVDQYIELTVYQGPNINSLTDVYTFNAEHISLAYNFSGGAIVYMRQGVLLERMTVVESIEEIIADALSTTTTTTFPGGIEIQSARVYSAFPTLLRLTFDGAIDDATITGVNSIANTFKCRVNGAYDIDFSGAFYWAAGLGFSIYLGDPAYTVTPTDVLTISYVHDGGGGMGWSDGAGSYLEDFTDYPVNNTVTTTTTSTSSTSSSSSSSTSTSSSSTSSSTSTSTTSTSSTSSSSTSSTSSSSTSSTSSTSTSTTSTSTTSTSSTSTFTTSTSSTSTSSTSTSSTSTSSTSSTSTSSTSTSSTSTSSTSTSTSSTSSTSTSSTSTSSTSTTSTSSTTTGEYDAEAYWDDGVDYFRLQVRSAALFLDQTITPTGFSGAEDTDWGNIWEKKLEITTTTTSTTTADSFYIISAVVVGAGNEQVLVTFNHDVDGDAPDSTKWSMKINGGAPVQCNATSINDNECTFNWAGDNPIYFGDTVTISYSGTGSDWQSLPDYLPLPEYTDYAVTNDITSTTTTTTTTTP